MQPNGSMPRDVIGSPIISAYYICLLYRLLYLPWNLYLYFSSSGLWYLSNKFLIKPGYRDQVSCPEYVLHAVNTYLGSFIIFRNPYQAHRVKIKGDSYSVS
jgi:hypothetical protein